jgi:hypothetical protein
VTGIAPSGTFLRNRGEVAYKVRWYVDCQAIVVYIDAIGPFVQMNTGPAAEFLAQKLADAYLSGIDRRLLHQDRFNLRLTSPARA